MTDKELEGLNLVLNEADLGPVHVDREMRRAQVNVRCLMLQSDGTEPTDRVLVLCLTGISRIAASLREGNWNDAGAPVVPLALSDLSPTILSFGGQIYGWEFFDRDDGEWAHWRDRLSFDEHFSAEPAPHILDLFQEGGGDRHLDFRFWFEDAWVQRRGGERPPLDVVVEDAKRWWDGMYAGHPATAGHGIVAAGPSSRKPKSRWPWSRRT